jgi:hypothetical protein
MVTAPSMAPKAGSNLQIFFMTVFRVARGKESVKKKDVGHYRQGIFRYIFRHFFPMRLREVQRPWLR